MTTRTASQRTKAPAGGEGPPPPRVSTLRLTGAAGEESERLAELEVSLRLRDDVVASLAHDLKGPLFAVSLNASLLERLRLSAPESDGRLRRSVEEIQHAVSQASVIVAKVLEVDALGDGQLTQDVHIHHTVDLIESAARVVEPLARARDVRVVTRVRDGAGRLECDRAQMVHALVALLANAVRRSPPGTWAELDATHTGLSVHLIAKDAGPALSEAEVARLLAPVADERGAATAGRLLRARRVVEMHGGSLRAHASAGGGMTFDASLPARALRR